MPAAFEEGGHRGAGQAQVQDDGSGIGGVDGGDLVIGFASSRQAPSSSIRDATQLRVHLRPEGHVVAQGQRQVFPSGENFHAFAASDDVVFTSTLNSRCVTRLV
jgi:hypothetical protein